MQIPQEHLHEGDIAFPPPTTSSRKCQNPVISDFLQPSGPCSKAQPKLNLGCQYFNSVITDQDFQIGNPRISQAIALKRRVSHFSGLQRHHFHIQKVSQIPLSETNFPVSGLFLLCQDLRLKSQVVFTFVGYR